jgi:hypothetical protein
VTMGVGPGLAVGLGVGAEPRFQLLQRGRSAPWAPAQALAPALAQALAQGLAQVLGGWPPPPPRGTGQPPAARPPAPRLPGPAAAPAPGARTRRPAAAAIDRGGAGRPGDCGATAARPPGARWPGPPPGHGAAATRGSRRAPADPGRAPVQPRRRPSAVSAGRPGRAGSGPHPAPGRTAPPPPPPAWAPSRRTHRGTWRRRRGPSGPS